MLCEKLYVQDGENGRWSYLVIFIAGNKAERDFCKAQGMHDYGRLFVGTMLDFEAWRTGVVGRGVLWICVRPLADVPPGELPTLGEETLRGDKYQ